MANEPDEVVERLRRSGWEPDGAGRWRIEVDDGRLVGVVDEEAGRFTARVLRHPTGPSGGTETVEAHGPTPFDDLAEAARYVEANIGIGT